MKTQYFNATAKVPVPDGCLQEYDPFDTASTECEFEFKNSICRVNFDDYM